MKYITVLHEDTGISFIVDIKNDEVDWYMQRLQTVLKPDCRFIVAETKFINHVISAHPRGWSPKAEEHSSK